MKEYTSEYLHHIRSIIEARNEEAARKELADLHPADIAELYQELDLDEAEFLYKLLDGDVAADVLMELDEDDRRKLLSTMPAEEIAKQFIDHLDTDDAVDIIQELDEEDRDEILSHIDDVEQAGDIIDLLKYDEDTAGGLMGTEMIVVNENWSMPECIKQMRMQAEDIDEIYYVYVVDNDYRLRGILPLKKLITDPSVSRGLGSAAAIAIPDQAATLTPQVVKLATMVVTALPVVCIYPCLQRYFVKGVTMGAVKG